MAVRLSVGFRNAICLAAPVIDLMDGGTIYLYGGTLPDSPDLPPGTPILAQITTDAATFTPGPDITPPGLRIQWASPGAVIKNGEWKIKGVANGTVTWFRWCWKNDDDHQESYYYPRVDGTVGDVFRMSNPTMTTGRISAVESFIFMFPVGS